MTTNILPSRAVCKDAYESPGMRYSNPIES